MIAHRRAIEVGYAGKMTVTIFGEDEVDGETLDKEQVLHEDVPCRLRRSQNRSADSDGIKSSIAYDLKVICAPEIEIPSGSQIKVEQDGMKYEFEYSGEPFIYPTHQEITITRGDVS